MRPQFLIAIGAIVALVAAAALILTLTREDETIGEIVLASGIAEGSNAPLDDVSEFPAGTTEVYATLQVRDLDAGDVFGFRWQGGADEAPVETEFELEEDADEETWVYGSLVLEDGLPAGEYSVEVTHNGELVERRAFTVAGD